MKVVIAYTLLALLAMLMATESDGWWSRRRRRRRIPACNWNRWNSWNFNCGYSCRVGNRYRYRYGYAGSYCYYIGWQRQSNYCYSKGCQQYCNSGRCSCRGGYRSSGRNCYDINECASNGGRGPCQTFCHNRVGSYKCTCHSGYYTCSTTRCCPVNCGRPKVPTSCPSSSFRDSQSIPPCKPLPYQSHCSTVFPNRCPLKCPTYYSIATYSGRNPFMRYWPSISIIGTTYPVACQANARWSAASIISRFYCRRNNDPPEYLRLTSTTINEHSPVGTTVAYLSTYDPNVHDTHIYSVRPSSAAIFFNVIGNRLVVTFVPRFNHHQGVTGDGNSFTITLRVSDRGRPAMYKDQVVTIRILDTNEPPERLALSNYVVKENVKVGTTIGTFTAYDPDNPSTNNPCTWTITGFNSGFFSINKNQLLVFKALNFEAQNNHPLQISCTDFGRPAKTTTSTFIIDVQDAQEPPITLTISNKQVDEDAKAGFVVATLTGYDQDKENLLITMSGGLVPVLAGGSATTRFGVSSTTCLVVPQHDQVKARTKCTANLVVQPKVGGAAPGTAGALDFETGGWFQLVFFARDASHPSLHKSLYVNVTVNDVNEAPSSIAIANLSIPESAPGGSLVSSLIVTDPDNSQRVVQRPSCSLVPGGDDSYFAIAGESPNMELEVAQTTKLDYETKPSYSISVTCNDHGLPPLSITRSFIVKVIDENEAPENLTLSNDRVKESVPIGAVVGTFSTIDPDHGNTFSYHFAPGFSTNAPMIIKGNQLVTDGLLDYETNDSYIIDVASVDQGGLEAIQVFQIFIEDVPEAPTDLTLDGNHTLPENSTAGLLVGNLIVMDADENQDPSCKVTGGRDMSYFSTGGDNGLELVASSSAMSLNYELMGTDKSLKVTVACTDLDGLGITKSFTVMVTDVNEAPTDITISNSKVKENQPAGTLVGMLSVTDVDAGQAHNCSVIDNQPQPGEPLLTTLFFIRGLNLYTKAMLDYEKEPVYSVEIECVDVPSDGQPGIAFDKPIVINVTDVNETPGSPCLPTFTIAENQADGAQVAVLNASDPDNEVVAGRQDLMYTVVNTVPFKVDPQTNALVKNGPLDYEKKKSYAVDIKVTDDGIIDSGYNMTTMSMSLSATFTCTVKVLDSNDPHASVNIRLVPSNASVEEHMATGTVIARVVTDDVDANAKHTYSIVETGVPLMMVGDNLTVTTGGQLVNFETNPSDILVTIVSMDEHNHSASRMFSIPVTDKNEKPTALCLVGNAIDENQKAGYKFGQLVVADPDHPPRSCNPVAPHLELPITDHCMIIDQTADQIYTSRFEITKTLGLVQKVPLDYEQYTFYDLQIVCQDNTEPLNVVANTFTITVRNVNERPNNLTVDASAAGNMPFITVSPTIFQVFVPEHEYNVPVLSFGVMDPDSPKQALVTYSVSGLNADGVFEMRNNLLFLLKPLDHEGGKMYILQVTVTDKGHPPLIAKVTVRVNITDRADKPSQVHLECSGGALFSLWDTPSRTRRQASSTATPTVQPLPTLPPAQIHSAMWGSSDDCSILTNAMVTDGYLIGKIFPEDQDSYKWYNFTLSGMYSDLFELRPYGMTTGNMWQAAWLRLSKKATATAASRFMFTQGNRVYDLRIDVVDQWGQHEIGQHMTVTTRDACYLGQGFCSSQANCTLDASTTSGYVCQCPPHHVGDGIASSQGCTQCSIGATVVNGKCVKVDECQSAPCMNGGTCIDGDYEFVCKCAAAYTGEMCETQLKTCALQTDICQNGGSCVDTKDDILCNCKPDYTGYYCEIETAACQSFPSFCEANTIPAFCAATPAIKGKSSNGICVDNNMVVHIVLESSCVPPSVAAIDDAYNHRASQYIEDVLNAPELHGNQDFCLYHTAQAQGSGGSGITVSGRKKRASPITGRQYLVQNQQTTLVKDGAVMHTVVILDSSVSFSPVTPSTICSKLAGTMFLHCLNWQDCHNSSSLNQAGFRCGQGPYTTTVQKEHKVNPQFYIELVLADPFATHPTVPACASGATCNIIHVRPGGNGNSGGISDKNTYVPASSEPFHKTTTGIIVIVIACVAFVGGIVAVVLYHRSHRKIKGRYDERLLHTTYDGASSSGSQVSLGGDGWRQKFVDDQATGAQGITNPMYEAAGGGGGNVQASGIVECENALYESPDNIRQMSPEMDN